MCGMQAGKRRFLECMEQATDNKCVQAEGAESVLKQETYTSMVLFVRTLTGKTIALYVRPTTAVDAVKQVGFLAGSHHALPFLLQVALLASNVPGSRHANVGLDVSDTLASTSKKPSCLGHRRLLVARPSYTVSLSRSLRTRRASRRAISA